MLSARMTGREPKRYYSVAEANAQVAALSSLFSAVIQMRAQLRGLYQRLDKQGHAPDLDLAGEQLADIEDGLPAEVERDLRLFHGMAESLQEHIEQISATGCVIKDIDGGLVDWPALDRGREIWLCWKYGETEVGYWHDKHTGFAGRRPVSELKEIQRA